MRTADRAARGAAVFPLWSVLALAGALRLAFVGRSELWFDEAYAALLTLEPVRAIVHELSRDSSPPLYYVLLRGWRIAFGPTAAALRALSVVAGVGAVYVVDRLGREVWTPAIGRCAALLLAISPLHVYYSQEARPYSLLVLFSALSLLALERLRRDTSAPLPAALFIASTTLALYTHNYGVFLLLPLAASAATRGIPVRVASACALVIAAAYTFWLPVLSQQIRTGTAVWVRRIWASTPPELAPVVSLKSFAIGGSAPSYVQLGGIQLPAWIHLIAYVTVAVLGIAAVLRRTPLHAESRRAALTLASVLAMPWLISFVFPIYVAGRYDVLVLPLFVLVLAAGLDHLNARLSFAIVIAGLAAASLASYYTRPPLHGASAQAARLVHHEGPHDAVVAVGFTRNPLEYYARTSGAHATFYSFPPSLGEHRGWLDERELENRAALGRQAADIASELSGRLQPTDRVWVVHSNLLGSATAVLLEQLSEGFAAVACPGPAEAMGMSCWVERRRKGIENPAFR